MNTFKTPKKTELPLSTLKGKLYLEVKYRLIWFREEHPDWGIDSHLVTVNDKIAIARAVVTDQDGKLRAVGHKSETPQGFADYIEKAETGAIGRALAHLGFGTQFAAEMMEDSERPADSPVPPKRSVPASERPLPAQETPTNSPENKSVQAPGDYIAKVGRIKGKKLADCTRDEVAGALKWFNENKPRSHDWAELADHAMEFLA